MKYLWLALSIFSLSAFAADDLKSLNVNAGNSIDREMRALKSSQRCIDSSKSEKEFRDCNYHPENFNSEIQKEEEQPDTGVQSEPTGY